MEAIPESTLGDREAQAQAAYKKRQDAAIAAAAPIREAEARKAAQAAERRRQRASERCAHQDAPAAADDDFSGAVPLQAALHAPCKSVSASSNCTSTRSTPEKAAQQQLQADAPPGSSDGESAEAPQQLAAEEDAETPLSVKQTPPHISCSPPADQPAQGVYPEQSPAEDTLPTIWQAEPGTTAVTEPAKVCYCLAVEFIVSACH